jgi:NAD(P)-dependent dehydrogenase (short-subunit alcohol dehydrogenase family)
MSLTGMFAVTGGGSGIGQGVCRRLAGEGARVAVLDVDGGGGGSKGGRRGGTRP